MKLSVRCLCLVAYALSNKYGVHVQYGGDTACTYTNNRGERVINIPGMESDDPNYLLQVRGYIDHESGHIRYTDDAVVRHLQSGSIEHTMWNVFEDYYVERMMGDLYPGCRQNLYKLSKFIFDKDYEEEGPVDLLSNVFQYVLLGVRSHLVSCLSQRQAVYRDILDRKTPGLCDQLDPIIQSVPSRVNSTADALAVSEEVLELLKQYTSNHPKNTKQMAKQLDGQGGKTMNKIAKQSGVGEQVAESISQEASSASSCDVAEETTVTETDSTGSRASDRGHGYSNVDMLTAEMLNKSARISAALDVQLRSLLQTWIMNRGGAARTGKLDLHKLHRLAVNNTRIFQQRVEKRGLNTEIVILGDASGSMRDDKKDYMTSCAIYGVVSSLRRIPGVKSSVCLFDTNDLRIVLRSTQPLHQRFSIQAGGGTLAGEALVSSLRLFSTDPDTRKLCIIMTDGDTDHGAYFSKAIQMCESNGIGVVGIGIQENSIKRYLPDSKSCVIQDLNQLCPELFRILRSELVSGGVR